MQMVALYWLSCHPLNCATAGDVRLASSAVGHLEPAFIVETQKTDRGWK